MITEAEALEFYLASQRRALRRFLPEPIPPTGFTSFDSEQERLDKFREDARRERIWIERHGADE